MVWKLIVRWILGSAATAVFVIMPAISAPAFAAGASSSSISREPEAGGKAQVSDVTVRKAAAAFPKILKINREAKKEIQQTNDPQQRQQILSSARDRQISALREEGISADDYDHVLVALNSDPGLLAKFKSYLNGGSGS
jgi:hypothetical protein